MGSQRVECPRNNADDDEPPRQACAESQRKAELCALRETTVARARMSAEQRVRQAEIATQLEHARLLAEVGNDRATKRLRAIAIGVGLAALLVAGGGGAMVKTTLDEQLRIEREFARVRAEADRTEAETRRLRAERDAAEAGRIASLERKLKDAERAADEAARARGPRGKKPRGRAAPETPGPTMGEPSVAEAADAPLGNPPNCATRDPMCS
jgi:hypothetical protein